MNDGNYILEVYETDRRGGSDAILSFRSQTPFMAIHVGEFIELDGSNFPKATPGQGRYRVVEVSHVIWNTDSPRHQVMVFVVYEATP